MKKLLLMSLLLASFTAMAQNEMVNVGVIPTPQQVVTGSGTLPVDGLNYLAEKVDAIPGASYQEQAYQLEIGSNGIVIRYVGSEGLNYATKTLDQLKKRYNNRIPYMTITDWPAYEYRGWLDDISRGPIANRLFRRQTRTFCDRYKMNFGNYYTEHTLYNEVYPDISGNSGLSTIDYPNDPYMMANLQCFAHFEKTLRIPFYQSLMDGPANVNPAKEDTYTFLRGQIENTIEAYYSSRFFNINCDETEGLGSGRARQYVDKVGADEAYCRHINRVYDIIQQAYHEAHGTNEDMEVLMWGDIVGKDPAMLKKLPKDMQYIIWSYVAKESYADMIAPFAKIHREQGNAFWVAPGVSHWSSTPQVRNYVQNIAYLARDGYLAGARGLMNTAWDDSGESLFGDCWHAMAWAAEMAWHPITATDPVEAKREMAMRERVFNENYDRMVRDEYNSYAENPVESSVTEMIYAVGDLNQNKWVGDWFNTKALMEPLLDFFPTNVSDDVLERCDSVDHIVAKVLEVVDSNMVPHFTYACHRIQCVSEKNRLRLLLYRSMNGGKVSKKEVQRLSQTYFKNLHLLKQEYLRLWDEECTDYSRNIICDRYDQLGREVMDARQQVFFSNDYREGKMYVTLTTLFNDRPIYFTVDGGKPSQGANLYKRPFTIGRSCIVKAVCYNKWEEPVYSEQYLLYHKGAGHIKRLNSRYSDYNSAYSGGGDNALADGVQGSENNYADGHWQGYWGQDVDVEYDFGSSTTVNSVSLRFLQHTNDWILTPQVIEIYTSADGKGWNLVRTEKFNPDYRNCDYIVCTDAVRDLKINTQYLRVVAKNPGKMPDWNPAHGNDSYLFCDEIVIE